MPTPRCEYCNFIVGHSVKCPNWDIKQGAQGSDYVIVNTTPGVITREKASELLKHTEELINGERARDYGEPHQSFEKIAKLWSTYLHHDITVTDVGMMMILLKVARNGRGKNKADNFVDICGYASLTGSEFFKNDDSK